MRGGLARRMCSDTDNSIFPPSVVVVVIGKKLLPQTLQKTVPSFSSGPSTLCPLPGNAPLLDSSWIKDVRSLDIQCYGYCGTKASRLVPT